MQRLLAFVLVTVLLVGVPAAAQPMTVVRVICSVENARTGAITDTLPEAVDSSAKGDTLLIRGTCVGGTVIRYTTLRLEGVPTTEQPTPTLDGGGIGRVLMVRARVVILDLTITNDRARYGAGVWFSDGVRHLGRLSLEGDTSITGNRAKYWGGGIWANGTVALEGSSSVSGNSATHGGGIHMGGTLTVNDSSSVTGNTASGYGGGIYMDGTLTVNDSSSVTGNTAEWAGGGIYSLDTLTLDGSSTVAGNTAGMQGGGIDTSGTGTFTLNGSSP